MSTEGRWIARLLLPSAVSVGLVGVLAAQTPPQPATVRAPVTVVIALVGENLAVRPVPLHSVVLAHAMSIDTVMAITSLAGEVQVALLQGTYTIRSVSPVTVDGIQYQWEVTHEVRGIGPHRVELTNSNARTTADASTPGRARQMAPEMEVYRNLRDGVFRIESGWAHGTGFLVDAAGWILTNAHVVAGQPSAVVVLDSVTRVRAQIVYRAEEADIAVLRVAPTRIEGRPVLPLRVVLPLAESGERVFAIGYPLHQEQTLTSGIVSGLRQGAVITDVNINKGNSGGPLVNLAGEVIAINTFGDWRAEAGPGVSGSVVISLAVDPLARARAIAESLPLPDDARQALMPSGRFRTHDLVAYADSVPLRRYAKFDDFNVGRFLVDFSTPPIQYVRRRAFEAEVAKDRKKREARAGMSEEERYSEMREMRDWFEYVGDPRAPVVTVEIEPRLGETSGSVLRRAFLTGAAGKATYRYQSDLRAAVIYRNGVPIAPIKGGTLPVKRYEDNRWVDLKDVANYGYYVIAHGAFAPDTDGTPPSIVIALEDLKNPAFQSCQELPREMVAAIWNDFVLYHAARGESFQPADPNRRRLGGPDKRTVCDQAKAGGQDLVVPALVGDSGNAVPAATAP